MSSEGANDKAFSQFLDEKGKPVVGKLGSDSEYILGESLGNGTFGRVWRVTRASDRRPFAAKYVKSDPNDPSAMVRAKSEVHCLSSCSHFAVVRIISSHHNPRTADLLIIMEYCDAGDINVQFRSKRERSGVREGFGEREARLILVQIALALYHMHGRKILHRDIKAANVFLSTAGLVKLGDFGLSRSYDTSQTVGNPIASTFCGTADYLAPEVWRKERYGARADVWSLGILAYELLFAVRPFGGERIREEILYHDVQYPEGHVISPVFIGLIDSMLKKDPSERITVRGILAHPCMQESLGIFKETVSRTRRLSDTERAFVLQGIAEADNVTASLQPPEPSRTYEGVVQKLKGSEYVSRYLVLRDGHLGIFRDRASCPPRLDRSNAKPIEALRGAKGAHPKFQIELMGGDGNTYEVHFESAQWREWVDAIWSALGIDSPRQVAQRDNARNDVEE